MFAGLRSPDITAWRRMSHPTDETHEPILPPDGDGAEPRRRPVPKPARPRRRRSRNRRPTAAAWRPTGGAAHAADEPEPNRPEPAPKPAPAAKPAKPPSRPRPPPAPVLADDDDEPPPNLVWYVLKVQSSPRGHDPRRPRAAGQDPGAAAVLRPDRGPDREDHRDPQQQEADRRAQDLSRLHHGRDGAEREDLVRGPRDARRRRLRRGPRHPDQDDRGRGQPDARPGDGQDRGDAPRSGSTSSAATASRSRTARSRTSRGPSRKSSRRAAWSRSC